MKLVGFILLALTCLLAVLKLDHLSLWSVGMGAAIGASMFTLLTSFKSETTTAPSTEQNPWEGRFHDLESQSAQNTEGLNREIQKLHQKLLRAEERCQSYQKLVDVHQGEIDRLKQENNQIGQQVIEKDRQNKELQLARIEPDLFDASKRQTESSHRELKKQFEEKSQALEQARIKLFRVESELLLAQKEKEEQTRASNPAEGQFIQQLKQAEEDKKKLEAELASLQQVVSQLSGTKDKKNPNNLLEF
jgi:hypothetical protein